VLVSDFDFELPDALIAQAPAPSRDEARMLVLDRTAGTRHAVVRNLPDILVPGDLVVVNDSRVIPARLLGHRIPSGGMVECLLLGRLGDDRWDALVHPGQKLRAGALVQFGDGDARLEGEILERRFHGRRVVRLVAPSGGDVESLIDRIGHVPLPPYIRRPDDTIDRERYQTVYANRPGSVAAPTAGLHLTEDLLAALRQRDIEVVAVTLHVGYGTFKPVRAERVDDHAVDPEPFEIDATAADAITLALAEHRRVVAVGTTTTRALEAAAAGGDGVRSGRGVADLFIRPGHQFQVVGGLLTNFHVPRSSLLMLVCALAGTPTVLSAYREAIAREYRFYSYGDCMLVV
jgi:S-adenosylmethionine:tRNA ribosyltransferase-isomerase